MIDRDINVPESAKNDIFRYIRVSLEANVLLLILKIELTAPTVVDILLLL
jgi:hypothetical protein